MRVGLLGRKVGMTQIYTEDGTAVPVTVLECGPCTVLQVRTEDRDGYTAVQLGFADKKRKNATQAARGHAKKVNAEPKRYIRELRQDKPEDVAAVAVINHAVRDFHTGFVLRKALEKTESGGAAAEKLRQHAQQMETAATQCVQRYLAANQNANAAAPNATTPREKPVDRPIMTVAQHAQAVIQAIQQWDKNQ